MQSPTRECILSSASSSNEIFVSGKNEFCRIVGNGISFESLVLGEAKKNKTWIPNQQGSGGIACVAVDVISKCVAYSPRSSQPKIYLHNAETKKLLGVLPGEDVFVEYQDICFSRNGHYLVAIGGVGDTRVYICDLKSKTRLEWAQEIQIPGQCGFVSFDPLDDRLLCVGGSFGMHFIHIRKEVDKVYGHIVAASLDKTKTSRALKIQNSLEIQNEETRADTYDFSSLETLLESALFF